MEVQVEVIFDGELADLFEDLKSFLAKQGLSAEKAERPLIEEPPGPPDIKIGEQQAEIIQNAAADMGVGPEVAGPSEPDASKFAHLKLDKKRYTEADRIELEAALASYGVEKPPKSWPSIKVAARLKELMGRPAQNVGTTAPTVEQNTPQLGLLGQGPTEPQTTVTNVDVRNALMGVVDAHGDEMAGKIIKSVTGQTQVAGLDSKFFQPIIDRCSALAAFAGYVEAFGEDEARKLLHLVGGPSCSGFGELGVDKSIALFKAIEEKTQQAIAQSQSQSKSGLI